MANGLLRFNFISKIILNSLQSNNAFKRTQNRWLFQYVHNFSQQFFAA
jgi:hypothetical protein